MELLQTQSQQLNYQQMQGLKLLQMGSLELEQYLRELAQENPMVDLEPESSAREEDDGLLSYLRWMEDNDHQNLYYSLPQCQVMNSKKGKKYPLSIKRRGDICDTNYNLFAFQRIHKIAAKRA